MSAPPTVERLGKYELIRQIGHGATGKVYHAVDTFSGVQVAIKRIDPAVLEDPEINEDCRKQFLKEASLAGRLDHPHIVGILEATVSEREGYVVMEYVPGGDLARYTKHDSLLPVSHVLELVFKCCGALDYAYRQGIIHRDIKPANIMVASGTDAKIADFGAALFYRAQATQAVTIGSPYYMSPEQIRGRNLSFLSDMYSLGVVTYELLTGVRPFQAESIVDLFHLIQKGEPVLPSAQRDGLPAEADAVVLRMLAADPQKRYASWADVALELAELGRFSTFRQDIVDSEKYRLLRGSEQFRGFSEPRLWELVRAATWSRLPARSVLMREDEPGEALYILAAGQVKVTKQGRLLNVLNAGECFGEMAYQSGTARQAMVEALSDVTVARLPFRMLGALTADCELALTKLLLHSLTERLALANARIAQMH